MADVSGSFTATGQSTTGYGRVGLACVGGTFVGTVAIEVQARNGSWYPMQTVTAPAAYDLELDEVHPIRFNCTAYTSGTATYSFDDADGG